VDTEEHTIFFVSTLSISEKKIQKNIQHLATPTSVPTEFNFISKIMVQLGVLVNRE
jgi:hypothetical protein